MGTGGLVFPISAEYNNKGVTEAQQSFARFSSDVEQKLGAATQIANKNLKDLDSTLKTASGSADQSRQVFGAFAGQATQQATMLAGNLGPVGAVLGQIVNQASQAKLSLTGFASVAGPIAAVSAGFMVLKGVMSANAEQAKLNKALQDSYTKSLLDGKTAAEALAASQKDMAKGVEAFNSQAGLFGKTQDITKKLVELGLTQKSFNALILGGKDAIDEWDRKITAAGKDLDNFGDRSTKYVSILKFMRQQSDNLGDSWAEAQIKLRFYNEDLNKLYQFGTNLLHLDFSGWTSTATSAFQGGTYAADGFGVALGSVGINAGNAAGQTQKMVGAIDDAQRALRAALDPTYANERAQIALQKAQEAYLKAKPADQQSALLNLKQAALDAAAAAATLAEKQPGTELEKQAAGVKAVTAQYQELADFFKNNPQLSRYFGNVPGAVGGITRQSMVGFNIAGPAGSYAAATPGTTVTSNNTANVNTVINVNGAYDPVMVAAQLRRLLLDDAIRRGLKNATANSWILT